MLDHVAEREATALLGDGVGVSTTSITDVLVDQVEFADVLVVSKADLATAELDRLEAKVSELLNTGRFDFQRASQASRPVQPKSRTGLAAALGVGASRRCVLAPGVGGVAVAEAPGDG